MRVLALASQKGGSGKTTLSGHLAVQAQLSGAGGILAAEALLVGPGALHLQRGGRRSVEIGEADRIVDLLIEIAAILVGVDPRVDDFLRPGCGGRDRQNCCGDNEREHSHDASI